MSNLSWPAALRVDEAASYLAVSRSKIYGLVKGGALKPVKLGHRTVFRRSDLDALLTSGTSVRTRPAKPAPDIFG